MFHYTDTVNKQLAKKMLLLQHCVKTLEKKENHNIRNYNDFTCIHKLGFINLLDFISEFVNFIRIK